MSMDIRIQEICLVRRDLCWITLKNVYRVARLLEVDLENLSHVRSENFEAADCIILS